MGYGKIIGQGNTATIYEWDEGTVLKLFVPGYPDDAIIREFQNAMALHGMDFAKPTAYEMIRCEERTGIIYDKVGGESLLEWVRRTGDLQGCAEYMASLHKSIVRNRTGRVPGYKGFLKSMLRRASFTDRTEREEAFARLDRLADGDSLCHGDYHPGNIMVSDGLPTVIDFMNVCRGHVLYDVARTVFLVQYTPIPADTVDRADLLKYKKALADLYLREMNVTRKMIQDYLYVIAQARKGECPNE